jgi:hypothetical protein
MNQPQATLTNDAVNNAGMLVWQSFFLRGLSGSNPFRMARSNSSIAIFFAVFIAFFFFHIFFALFDSFRPSDRTSSSTSSLSQSRVGLLVGDASTTARRSLASSTSFAIFR